MSYFSQTENNYREVKSQRIEKTLQRMAVLHFILYIRIKGEDVSGLHEIHRWWIKVAGESKAGKSLRLDKK